MRAIYACDRSKHAKGSQQTIYVKKNSFVSFIYWNFHLDWINFLYFTVFSVFGLFMTINKKSHVVSSNL